MQLHSMELIYRYKCSLVCKFAWALAIHGSKDVAWTLACTWEWGLAWTLCSSVFVHHLWGCDLGHLTHMHM